VARYELGRANFALGNLDAVEQALEQLLDVADKSELREYQARGRWLSGQLALTRGDLSGALDDLEDARARAEAIGARLVLWRIDAALGDVHQAADRRAEANVAYQQAWKTLQDVTYTLPDEGARESLLSTPLAADLREKIGHADS
jgi:tetratricopeptide (TPR) repeat protein